MSYLISNRQTTFWDFAGEKGTSRVHFLRKREWHYSHEHVPAFDLFDEHPLLLDYVAPWSELYVSSPADNSSTLIKSIGNAATSVVEGWRPASHYLNDRYAHAALQDGYGLLLRAPKPMVEEAKAVLDHHRVRYSEMPLRRASSVTRALVAGPNWVVAESFRIEHH
jgi:hypothetical protein